MTSQTQTSTENYTRFVILLDQVPGKETTAEHIKGHIQFLRRMESEGRLVLCGPFADYRGGMVIIKAQNIEEAKQIALTDPFVQTGVRTHQVRTWMLSCEANNHLGRG